MKTCEKILLHNFIQHHQWNCMILISSVMSWKNIMTEIFPLIFQINLDSRVVKSTWCMLLFHHDGTLITSNISSSIFLCKVNDVNFVSFVAAGEEPSTSNEDKLEKFVPRTLKATRNEACDIKAHNSPSDFTVRHFH